MPRLYGLQTYSSDYGDYQVHYADVTSEELVEEFVSTLRIWNNEKPLNFDRVEKLNPEFYAEISKPIQPKDRERWESFFKWNNELGLGIYYLLFDFDCGEKYLTEVKRLIVEYPTFPKNVDPIIKGVTVDRTKQRTRRDNDGIIYVERVI